MCLISKLIVYIRYFLIFLTIETFNQLEKWPIIILIFCKYSLSNLLQCYAEKSFVVDDCISLFYFCYYELFYLWFFCIWSTYSKYIIPLKISRCFPKNVGSLVLLEDEFCICLGWGMFHYLFMSSGGWGGRHEILRRRCLRKKY